jgi:hypothetical protein
MGAFVLVPPCSRIVLLARTKICCEGFKYFGLLNGLAFALSGVSQVFMSALVAKVQGTCHTVETADAPCSPGQWDALHAVELVLLAALMLAPRLTRCESRGLCHTA